MFQTLVNIMYFLAFASFVSLYFVPAGYGKMANGKWGVSFNNKIGWILMECPTIIVCSIFFIAGLSIPFSKEQYFSRSIVISFFVLHYVYRSCIFPFLLRGKSQMPISIVLMGAIFNTINAFLICWWTFYICTPDFYTYSYLQSPSFILGLILFFVGFIANIDSDAYIRSLRQKGDSKHYFPHRHLYKYVSSANYLCEIIEWLGFAILTQNPAVLLFFFWTCANLLPRAHAIYKKYRLEFPEEMKKHKIKRIIPFIY